MVDLKNYFQQNSGTGILATSDSDGNVNSAIYAKPHVMDGDTVAFIMRQRLTHKNLQENPKAHYLFKLDDAGHHGVRIYLEKITEERNSEKIEKLQRRKRTPDEDERLGPKHLVYFKIKKVLTLVGEKTPGFAM